MSNRDPHFIPLGGSTIADACRFDRFRRAQKMPKNVACAAALSGNDGAADALAEIACRSQAGAQQSRRSRNMRKILAIAAIAGAIGAPIAAQAQGVVTTGVVRGGVVNDEVGIAVDQRPAFREYIVRERVPNYTIPDRVVVGGVLPETGVTYYDVPQTFGVTPYRYTVVNGQTVLVEPRSRRIVQVVE
jgi:hypothetical protein